MFSTTVEAKIIRLHHGEGWPPNTIARQVGVHHCVVRRVLREHGLPVPKLAPRPSKVDPYVPFIHETLEKYPGLRATRLTLIDRLCHRCEVVEIAGPSYRSREARERASMKHARRRKVDR